MITISTYLAMPNGAGDPPTMYVLLTKIADLMDDNFEEGQWSGSDVCDALGDLIEIGNGWSQCDDHGSYSAAKDHCPFDHEETWVFDPGNWRQWGPFSSVAAADAFRGRSKESEMFELGPDFRKLTVRTFDPSAWDA